MTIHISDRNSGLYETAYDIVASIKKAESLWLIFPYDISDVTKVFKKLDVIFEKKGKLLYVDASMLEADSLLKILQEVAFTHFFAQVGGSINFDIKDLLDMLSAIEKDYLLITFSLYDETLGISYEKEPDKALQDIIKEYETSKNIKVVIENDPVKTKICLHHPWWSSYIVIFGILMFSLISFGGLTFAVLLLSSGKIDFLVAFVWIPIIVVFLMLALKGSELFRFRHISCEMDLEKHEVSIYNKGAKKILLDINEVDIRRSNTMQTVSIYKKSDGKQLACFDFWFKNCRAFITALEENKVEKSNE